MSELSSGMHGGFRTTLLMACLERAPSSGLGHWPVSGRATRGVCADLASSPGSFIRACSRQKPASMDRRATSLLPATTQPLLHCDPQTPKRFPHGGCLSPATGPTENGMGRAGLGASAGPGRRGGLTPPDRPRPCAASRGLPSQGMCPAVPTSPSLHVVPNVLKPVCHDPRGLGRMRRAAGCPWRNTRSIPGRKSASGTDVLRCSRLGPRGL